MMGQSIYSIEDFKDILQTDSDQFVIDFLESNGIKPLKHKGKIMVLQSALERASDKLHSDDISEQDTLMSRDEIMRYTGIGHRKTLTKYMEKGDFPPPVNPKAKTGLKWRKSDGTKYNNGVRGWEPYIAPKQS